MKRTTRYSMLREYGATHALDHPGDLHPLLTSPTTGEPDIEPAPAGALQWFRPVFPKHVDVNDLRVVIDNRLPPPNRW